MNSEVYVRNSLTGFAPQLGAEIVDEWEGGCLIRSEEPLPTGDGIGYYVVEGPSLVAVKLPPVDGSQGPFDYAAEKDRSDIREVPR
jgi:hypothetical protein